MSPVARFPVDRAADDRYEELRAVAIKPTEAASTTGDHSDVVAVSSTGVASKAVRLHPLALLWAWTDLLTILCSSAPLLETS